MEQAGNYVSMPINRTYKDRLFIMIFNSKKELLELYNAANGTNYDDPELLEINTLENAIYLSMHNDISFIIDSRLTLYEHQSTSSPNLPLRFLLYIADLYSALTRNKNLYGSRTIEIPTPRFVIFYNGKESYPDWQELRLSESFSVQETEPWLELKAVMLNINKGHNPQILNSCKALSDYAEYVSRIRGYAESMPIEQAVEAAITECITEGILEEFLCRNRAEAKKVSIYEYNEEKIFRDLKEESREIGLELGLEEGRRQGIREGEKTGENNFALLTEKLLEDSKMKELLKAAKDEAFRDSLYKMYGIK